jgi:chorismate-pyruvate lyase
MNESLAWLHRPETAIGAPALLDGLVRDIRLILVHPDLGNVRKLSAIAAAVDQLCPPPAAGEDGIAATVAVAAMLAQGNDPATLLFEKMAGEPVRMELAAHGRRPLTAVECLQLLTPQGSAGHQRSGTLRGRRTGLVTAEVASVVIPERLPEQAQRDLGLLGTAPSGVPLGKVLDSLGGRREPLGTRVTRDGDAAVESSARMWLAGLPVALASERVPAAFCQRLEGVPGLEPE